MAPGDGLGLGVPDGDEAGLGEAVGVDRAGVGVGVAVGGTRVDAGAVLGPAHATVTTTTSAIHLLIEWSVCGTMSGVPQGTTGMRGFDRAGERSVASRGTPFPLVNPNGRQTTADNSYALAA